MNDFRQKYLGIIKGINKQAMNGLCFRLLAVGIKKREREINAEQSELLLF